MAQGQTSASELGQLLIAGRREMDRAESRWLATLAEFDRSGEYLWDGHLSSVTWLADRCGLSRHAAAERVRTALELARRPLVQAAFAEGALSFSKVRAITRITGGDDELDQHLIAVARIGTAADLDRVVVQWRKYRGQETPPDDAWLRRGLRTRIRFDGVAVTEVTHLADEADRLMQVLDAYIDRGGRPAGLNDQHLEESVPAGTISASNAQSDPAAPITWSHRRVDALMDLLELGAAHAADAGLLDPQRAQVSVLVDYEMLVERSGRIAELSGGRPLSGDAARRLACAAGIVRIVTRGVSEILDVGRETRAWTAAQRRAIRARHGGRCAYPGCERRITQIHHCDPWGDGGRTDIAVGVAVCAGHHHLVHDRGWTVAYAPETGVTTFTDPTGAQTVESPPALRFAC